MGNLTFSFSSGSDYQGELRLSKEGLFFSCHKFFDVYVYKKKYRESFKRPTFIISNLFCTVEFSSEGSICCLHFSARLSMAIIICPTSALCGWNMDNIRKGAIICRC